MIRFNGRFRHWRLGRFKKLAGVLVAFGAYIGLARAQLPPEFHMPILDGLGAVLLGGTVYQLRNDPS